VLLSLGRPSDARLRRILARGRESQPTYRAIAVTQTGRAPAGYRRDDYATDLGDGDETWDRAVLGLRQWVAHTQAGLDVYPTDAPLLINETLLLLLKLRSLHVVAPCRIVELIDEPGRRFGFAYATLPGHPEDGEESFVVARTSSGAVRFDVAAISRPSGVVARVGSPAARAIQRRVTNRYLEGLRRFASRP
jgi:uncharacterized protein (UPF0548 family)